jgi:hypothetical protein
MLETSRERKRRSMSDASVSGLNATLHLIKIGDNGGVERSPRNAGSDPKGGVGVKWTSARTIWLAVL